MSSVADIGQSTRSSRSAPRLERERGAGSALDGTLVTSSSTRDAFGEGRLAHRVRILGVNLDAGFAGPTASRPDAVAHVRRPLGERRACGSAAARAARRRGSRRDARRKRAAPVSPAAPASSCPRGRGRRAAAIAPRSRCVGAVGDAMPRIVADVRCQ